MRALLARLLAESSSIHAAMKAGRRTRIACRVYRASQDRWEDWGPVAETADSWRAVLARVCPAKVIMRFRYKGKEIERATF